jgi:hypothetical protein
MEEMAGVTTEALMKILESAFRIIFYGFAGLFAVAIASVLWLFLNESGKHSP